MSPTPPPGELVNLPSRSLQGNGPSAAGSGVEGAVSGDRILVVEDERHTRLALQRFLQRHGWQTIGFASASDARAWLESTGNGPGQPVAGAVIDVHLPDGDGIQLTAALRQQLGGSVPIVIVSGDTSMDTLRRLKDAGADRFVGKPMSLPALREALAPGSTAPDA